MEGTESDGVREVCFPDVPAGTSGTFVSAAAFAPSGSATAVGCVHLRGGFSRRLAAPLPRPLDPVRRHVEHPRQNQRERKTEGHEHDDERHPPVRYGKVLKGGFRDRDGSKARYGVRHPHAHDLPAFELLKEIGGHSTSRTSRSHLERSRMVILSHD